MNVSIVIPAYNAQKTLRRCIDSILNLDFDKHQYEVIVVDNNSTDETASIIKSFPEVVYVNEAIQGRSHARNCGARLAHGSLLAFVDSDVFLEPEWLKHLVASFNSPTIGGGQGRVIPCNHDGQVGLNNFRIRQQNEATKKSNIILKLMYAESPMVNSAACMYRKEAFDFVKGFDVLLERHEDIDLAKRVCVAGFDLVAVRESVANVEYHGVGWWSYFVRTFSEGATKECYNIKWKQFFSSSFGSIASTSSLSEIKKKSYALNALKLNLQMFTDEILFNVLRSLLTFDFYFFLKAINASFKVLGRIYGMAVKDYPENFIAGYRKDLLERSIFLKNDVEVKIDENIRFVIESNEILYAINIQKNEIVNFGSFQAFKEILNQRVLSNHSN